MKNMKKKAMAAVVTASMVMSGMTAVSAAEQVEFISEPVAETFLSEPTESNDVVYGIMPLAVEEKVKNFVGPNGEYQGAWLKEGQLSSQDGSKDKNLGKGWVDKSEKNLLFGAAMGEDDTYRVWKLEIDGGVPETAHLWFYNDENDKYEEANISGFTPSGQGATCQVITPDGYRLVGGCFNPAGGIKADYAGRHTPEHTGTVTVTADVDAWHNEITPHEYYERDVDEYYERTVDEYYERTVDEYFERTVDEYYERTVDKYYERTVDEYYERAVDEYYQRPVTEIYQRYAQKYLIPVFEKKLAGNYNDTLVTRLDYTDNTAKATPKNGGAFKNGHTYVTVNVAEASKEGGVWYTIADSSKNNGKKTPDQYNRPIDYMYNVKIADGKLTVSCGDDRAFASVGAEIWAKAPKDAKNAPKHYNGSVTVDVPKNDGTVDIYVHFDKLGWYETDDNGDFVYQFKEWRYDDSRTEYDEEYTKIDTVYGDYAFVRTEYGDYELVDTVKGEYELANTEFGEYELADTVRGDYVSVNTEYGNYELADTEYGEYELARTDYGEYELVKTENVTRKVKDNYAGTLTLTVDGEEAELNTELTLAAGEHTFVLSGDGFEPETKTVSVVAGETKTVNFEVNCQYENVTLDVVEHHADREATRHEADLEATRHEADKAATEHFADKEATEHYADLEATRHEADKAAEKHYNNADAILQYNEEYLYREDIKLGDEIDYNGDYAVKLN